MRTFPRRFVLRALALALLLPAGAADAKPKALIEFGWDEPDPAFMRRHVAQMETMPFDGCVYHVGGDRGGAARGITGAFTWQAWGPRAWREADLASELRDLRATTFTRFKHNFLRVNVTPGTIDWFGDYSPILANLTLAASLARRGGSKGVLLDTETYETPIFSYSAQKRGRTFAQVEAQVKRRGADVMRALEAGYPGITVFLTLAGTHADIERRGNLISFEKQPYGLLPAFVDGMVEAAGPGVRIVDGVEAAYPARRAQDVDLYFAAQDSMLERVADPARYRRVVSRGIGLWIDFDRPHRPWRTDAPARNYRTPDALRGTLRRALERADDYVWLYAEGPRWWSASGRPVDLPAAYVEAVRDARVGLAP